MILKRLRNNCAMCWGRRVSFLNFFSSTEIPIHQRNFWGGTRSKKFTGRFYIVLQLLVQFSLKMGLFRPILSENWQKRLLCELKLSDDDDLYLVRSVLMRPCVVFKKEIHCVSPPSVGGRKCPQNDPQKGCAIIAQCAGVGESHFWIFFLRLKFPYIKATFEGVLGKKNWAQDFPIVLVPPLLPAIRKIHSGVWKL